MKKKWLKIGIKLVNDVCKKLNIEQNNIEKRMQNKTTTWKLDR